MKHLNTKLRSSMAALAAALTLCASAAVAQNEGSHLMRPGEWGQGAGSYLLQDKLRDARVQDWPLDGWYRVTHREGALQVVAVRTTRQVLPDFLQEIAAQAVPGAAQPSTRFEAMAEAIDTQYMRVPGVKMVEGRRSTVKFSKGVLRPKLGHDYSLKQGDLEFSLRVQNGLRNNQGKPYGEGALYTISYGGQAYNYLLGQQGWDSTVQAIADLDGDGKPDFLIHVNASNGSEEFLLLSGQAKPGQNPPTAKLSSLFEDGC